MLMLRTALKEIPFVQSLNAMINLRNISQVK